uniref:Protein FAR1-RELATED SEQUENCE 4 n=1 Tax=Rhizophora mucronata TaxID=61149 RepID=A0A2P2JI72_RHIMU
MLALHPILGEGRGFMASSDCCLFPYLVQENFASMNSLDALERRLLNLAVPNPTDLAYSL